MHLDLHTRVKTISNESWSSEGAVVPEGSPTQIKKMLQTSKSTKWQHAKFALVPKSATSFQENKFLHTEEEAMPVTEWSSVALMMKRAGGGKCSRQGGHQLQLCHSITAGHHVVRTLLFSETQIALLCPKHQA